MPIFTIEGNVGAGKTTLLKYFEENNPEYFVCYEPVEEWINFKLNPGEKSIFELFYEDKKKYAFVFQMMALQSRFENLQKTIEQNKDKIIICERSIFTDYEVFAKLQKQEGNISDIELHVYEKWHAFFMNMLKPDIRGIIYLQTDPTICIERIHKRNRKGEENCSHVYLEHLHTMHENWLQTQKIAPVLTIDGFSKSYLLAPAINTFIKEQTNSLQAS